MPDRCNSSALEPLGKAVCRQKLTYGIKKALKSELHTVDVGARRKGGISCYGLSHIVVGSVHVMILLDPNARSARCLAGARRMNGKQTLVKTL